jgi:dTDP-4-dehydrorhamnose reductase
MIKVLLVGASSFLGQAFYCGLSCEKNISTKGTYFSSRANDAFTILDITSARQIKNILEKENPDYILWVAGNKDLKKCQEDYDFAYQINTRPIFDLVECLKQKKQKSRIFFVSTDYVFDGERGCYKETDPLMPATNYGKTNALAEELLLNSDIDFKIIRTAAVMGRGGQFFDWLIKALSQNEEVSLYTNVVFSPTPLHLLVQSLIGVIRDYDVIQQKILHLVGNTPMSRYTFGKNVAEILGSKSLLIPVQLDFSSTLFQKNLSLLPSSYMQQYDEISFMERIANEIRACI